MKKIAKGILKNIMILARSKGSALIVLLAPLIIVFIIGFGFMDAQDTTLNIGVHERQESDLTKRYIDSFDTPEYNIIMYDDEFSCENSILDGLTVMCAVFSEDFELRDDAKNEIIFYVDESRMNLIDSLISSFTTTMSGETSEISEELASKLISIVDIADEEARESLALIIKNRADISSAKSEVGEAGASLGGLDTGSESVSLSRIENLVEDAEEDFLELRKKALDLVSEANKANLSEEEDLKKAISDLNKTVRESTGIKNFDDLSRAVRSVASSVSKMSDKLDEFDSARSDVISNINELSSKVDSLEESTDKLKNKQERIISEIESFDLRSARRITSPINTHVRSVATADNRLSYSFSYLLSLAILFVGLMLSSTLFYMEKDSRSFFRNFTTPTPQRFFALSNYLTSMIVILIQTILIITIAYFTLEVPILNNLLITSAFLILGITLFVLMGLLIGLMANTSEAVTMSNIIIGSVFLFVSNLILPLETLSPLVSKIASFNPYVIISEGIRKSMLFDLTFAQIRNDLILLSVYILLLVGLMVLVNKLGFKHFLAMRRHRKNMLVTAPENLILEIGNKERKIKNMPELIEVLKELSEEEYNQIIKEKNIISDWLKNNLKRTLLAIRIKNKKLPEVIKKLERHQKAKDRKNKKKLRQEEKKSNKN